MKGHVPTPDDLAEKMVRRLFQRDPPTSADRILYPGCGTAPFAAAVERVCTEGEWELPDGLGVESNPAHLDARDRDLRHVTFEERDFLATDMLDAEQFTYIIGNPPYVPIEQLNEDEKRRYKAEFTTAVGRFDLYLLFFERAIALLEPDGVLSVVTPEKFEYVETAAPLRRLLTSDAHVEGIEHIAEDAFTGLVTFPCITTICRNDDGGETTVRLRDGSTHTTTLPTDGDSWASSIRNISLDGIETGATLGDVTRRISPGMATGADNVFVLDRDNVPPELEAWVRPTVSGRQLREHDGPYTDTVFVCPYRDDGSLPEAGDLGAFGQWAEQHRERLEDRSCVKKGGKVWYAWHETPPMEDLLQPKIVFKDITKEPMFWAEQNGDVVPKHSVYYLVPKDNVPFEELRVYLNSPEARMWMEAHCQKAANGFYRLQSRVLKELPVPAKWAETYQTPL